MEFKFRRIYELEMLLLDLEKKQTALKNSVSQARYDLRNAKVKVLEYEGSFRSFIDRLRGTRDTNSEQLHRMCRHAEEILPSLECELESVQQTITQVKAELAQLPSAEEIPLSREKYVLDAGLCFCAVEPILEETLDALLECRTLEQGQRVGEIISIDERQSILSKPHTVGALCTPWLLRLENALSGLDIPFEIPDFYRNPAAYLAVTQYTRRDRLNAAIDQTLHLKKLIPQLREIVE